MCMTRLAFRLTDPAGLDRAEEQLTRDQLPRRRFLHLGDVE
jgi:hypothetical protein